MINHGAPRSRERFPSYLGWLPMGTPRPRRRFASSPNCHTQPSVVKQKPTKTKQKEKLVQCRTQVSPVGWPMTPAIHHHPEQIKNHPLK